MRKTWCFPETASLRGRVPSVAGLVRGHVRGRRAVCNFPHLLTNGEDSIHYGL